MLEWFPDWDTAEWTSVASALFTAAAATAARLSARASASLIRSGRVAFVSGGVTTERLTGQMGLTFANAGPALAIHVQYLIVSGGRKHGGTVADGHLAAAAATAVRGGEVVSLFADQLRTRVRCTIAAVRPVIRVFLVGVFRYRYPVCCCLRFALDSWGTNSCYERGLRYSRRRDEAWVPCGWLHRPDLIAGPDADPDELRFDDMIPAAG